MCCLTAVAVIGAKRMSNNPGEAAEQAKHYAQQIGVPYVFLANGAEVQFWEWEREAFPHAVKPFQAGRLGAPLSDQLYRHPVQ